MEEKFLKLRQEREEQRQQRAKETVAITAQRQEYESEAEQLEAEVTQRLERGEVDAAQQHVDTLRTLVQDTTNSISLTAHEMARANAILARLQQLIDEKRTASAAPKKFAFSSKLKAKSTAEATTTGHKTTAATPVPPAAGASPPPGGSSATAGFGTIYGPARGADLFIRHAKSAFINDCVDCTVYCQPVAGSVFLSKCVNCRVYVACHQLRLKDCAGLDLYVWCASTPIIETCDTVRFGPYRCWGGLLQSTTADGTAYATHAEWVRVVGEIADTARTEQNYAKVDDFQWVKKSASPHWRVLAPGEEVTSDVVFGPPTPPTSVA